MKNKHQMLSEMFGDPIDSKFGTKIGDVVGIGKVGAVGVRSVAEDAMVCPDCGMMPIHGRCGCEPDDSGVCPSCGMMPLNVEKPCSCTMTEAASFCSECGMSEGVCECGYMNEKEERKGPSKKTAQKILRGTKSFKEKMKKVSGWAEDPAAAAAWMMHKATGKWPREK